MRSKKCLIVGLTLAAYLFGLHTTLWGQEPKDPNEKIKLLQEKIKQLENVVETQQNTIRQLNQKLNEQTTENERLKKLCSQAGIDISPLQDTEPSKVESQNLSKVTLNQLYQFYNGPVTDLQREEQYKNSYKGKWVQWTGTVVAVWSVGRAKDNAEHYRANFIYPHPNKNKAMHKETVSVNVEFDEMLKKRLLSFHQGDIVTYQGKLPDNCEGLASINFAQQLLLTDGRIVSPVKK
jgi:uncharacterized coiled-coil protein SlyX